MATTATDAALRLTDSSAKSIQGGSRIVVFLALLADFLLLTMPLPIMPAELACNDDGSWPPTHTGCVSDTWIFLLFASKAALQIAANPFMGCAVDKYGPLLPLRFSLAVMAISTAGFAFGLWLNDGRADTVGVVFPVLFAARAVQGLASGGVMTGGMALVNMAHPESERGSAAGTVMTGMALGVLAGPVVAGALTKIWSSWGAFLVIAALIVVAMAAQAVLLKGASAQLESLQREAATEVEVAPPVRGQSGSFVDLANGSIAGSFTSAQASRSGAAAAVEGNARQGTEVGRYNAYGDPFVLVVAGCSLVSSMSIALLEPVVPLYLSRPPFLLAPFSQSLVWSASTLAYMVSTPIAGFLADRIPGRVLLFGGLALMALGVSGVVLVGQLWCTVVALLIVGAAMGFIETPSSPLLAKIADFRGTNAYGRVFATMDMATSLGFVLGPLIAAAIKSSGLPYLATTLPAAVACLLFAPLTLSLRKIVSA
eukprot:TRINITY_DN57966_c0_g1_i1.p1 TRINITY_DN57966_c0_g1~~TRINITY_DN57966_c0_g1_i1.p1  ORF type:complete len:484 (+),score=60.15 TRINITY_DN57966_c0_g1_i1:74-1525(+)